MRLDIQQLLAAGNSTLPFEFDLPTANIGDIVSGTAHVKGGICNHGGYLELSAVTDIKAVAVCGRCGEQFDYCTSFDTVRPVAKNLSTEGGTDGEADFALCDYILCDEDGFVNLGAVFVEELLLQLPTRFLCSEGCKGLCLKCGINLNKGNCNCVHKEIDPRLEVLKSLLK